MTSHSSLVRRHKSAVERRIGLVGAAWICVVALVPVYRLVEVHFFARLDYLTFVLVILSLMLGRVARPKFAELWVLSGIGAMTASALVGNQADLLTSIVTGGQLAVLLACLPFIFTSYAQSRGRWLASCVVAFLVVQSASAAVGIAQAALGLSPFGFAARQGRANGLAEHPNVLGLMCALALLALLYMMRRLGTRGRLLAASAILLNITALVLTGSLSSMLAFAAGLLVLLPAARMTWRAVVATLAVGTLAIPLMALASRPGSVGIGTLIESRVQSVTGETSEEGSLEIRQQTWAAAWTAIQESPLFGVGMDSTHQAVYGNTVTHNYLLHYWYRGGLILFAVAVAISVVAMIVVVRSVIKARDALAAGVIATVLAFAMTAAFFDQHSYWIPFLLAFSALGLVTETPSPPPRLSKVKQSPPSTVLLHELR